MKNIQKIIIQKEEPKKELSGVTKGTVNVVMGKTKQETLKQAAFRRVFGSTI